MDSETKVPSARVFFALWPDEAARAALAAWQPPLAELCGGKIMRPANLHNTLVFLGDVALGRLEALQLAAQEVRGRPFDLHLDTARYWGHNHIVYAAPASVPRHLLQLADNLEKRLHHHHFHFDRRDYKPHITLLRHARWNDAPLPELPTVTWKMHDFVLAQSVGGESGSRYEVLARFPLSESY